MSLSYVTVRLAQIVPTFFLMMAVIFGLMRLLPGDATAAILGIHATEEDVANRRDGDEASRCNGRPRL